MSTHVFTITVECEDSEEYERAIASLSEVGEITDEKSDFR